MYQRGRDASAGGSGPDFLRVAFELGNALKKSHREAWLKSQDDPRLSAMGKDLAEVLTQKTAWVFTRRYPKCDQASARRYSRICMQTVQALLILSLDGTHQDQIDEEVITDLKTMILAYLQATLGSEEHDARENTSY